MERSTIPRGARAAAVLASTLLATAGAVAMAPAAAAADNASLGHTCDGQFANTMKFTIAATGTIPVNSSWTVSTSEKPDYLEFTATAESSQVSVTRINDYSMSVKAIVAIPASTVIKVQPSNFSWDQYGATRVSISGYGGEHAVSYSMSSQPC